MDKFEVMKPDEIAANIEECRERLGQPDNKWSDTDYNASDTELVAFEEGFRRGAAAELFYHYEQAVEYFKDIPPHVQAVLAAAMDVVGLDYLLPGRLDMDQGFAACCGDEWTAHWDAWQTERSSGETAADSDTNELPTAQDPQKT